MVLNSESKLLAHIVVRWKTLTCIEHRKVCGQIEGKRDYLMVIVISGNYCITQNLKIPVIGLSLRKTEDGLLISARNLYRSSSLKRSPS